jgi:hypothetical protein
VKIEKNEKDGYCIEKRPKRIFTDQFKQQMVKLYYSGKSKAEIIKEYEFRQLVDLFNREIISCSAGIHKDAQLVYDAFASVKMVRKDISKIIYIL